MPKKKVDLEELVKLKKKGYSKKALAEHFGVTKRAIRYNEKKARDEGKLDWDDKRKSPEGYLNLEEKIKRQKDKLVRKYEKRALNRLTKQEALHQLIVNKIETTVSAIPKVKPTFNKPKVNYKKNSEDAVLMISDIEIGEEVCLDETGGLGKYNLDIMKQRAENLKHGVEEILNIHRQVYPIDTLYILGLGDWVHGQLHTGAWSCADIETPVVKQMFEGINAIAPMLIYFLPFVNKIEFYGTPGNHGRCGKKYEEKVYVNWDYILYKFLESRLRDYKDIEFNITESWSQIVKIRDLTLFLTHGDDTRSYMGLPYYGLERDERKNQGLHGEFFDFSCMGHFHRSCELETNTGRIMLNGSWVGGDTYSMKKIKSKSKPAQKIFGVCNSGKSWLYDIDLTRKRKS